jgi:hypothetical protein
MSYGLTVDILQEVLPLSKKINAATVRNNVHAVGQRIDKELGEEKVFNNLDWFHITMRLTVMRQLAKGLGPQGFELQDLALRQLERIKWFLWHGNVFRALQTVSWLNMDIDVEDLTEKQQKLLKKLDEFETYIRNNAMLIPNYGERWRYGETISTAFVESTINQVVSKRMVKKQQMRWSQQGAHLLLQIRTRVLKDELREIFGRWYPPFAQEEVPMKKAA